MTGSKMAFVKPAPPARRRRRSAPLRGTLRRCAALRARPPGATRPRAARANHFLKHEKNAYIFYCMVAQLRRRVALTVTQQLSIPKINQNGPTLAHVAAANQA